MNSASQHTFQILTKRAERLSELYHHLEWSNNIWMGVTVENDDYTDRIERLKETNAFVKFISMEPLIGPIGNVDLSGIDWIIVGGESGPKPRPIKKEWVIDLKNRCHDANIAFFFKQWGGTNKKKAGRLLDGRTWDEMPTAQMAA